MSGTRLEAHYDRKYAGAGDKPFAPISVVARPRTRVEMAVRVISRTTGKRYLEIGAGSGDVLLSCAHLFDELVATELSQERAKAMGEQFRRRADNVSVLRNNLEVEGLPYPDDHFDTAVMIAVIEHLIDPISALGEVYRVLRPGGRLVLDTPNIAKWTRRIKLLVGRFPSTASFDEGLLCYDRLTPTDLHDEGHLHYFTFRSLERICSQRVGFRSVQRCGYGSHQLARVWPEMFSDVFLVATK